MNVGAVKTLNYISGVQLGGCQVPGLKVAPDPVGSEDLKQDL